MDIQTILKSEKTHIIDVREVYEFQSGHIDGAINMPLSTFGDYLDQLKKMEGPKVFYCRSGNRSGQAVSFLSQNGYSDVYNGGSLSIMSSFLIPN
jgi:rhodanese-related sulfurtransferase